MKKMYLLFVVVSLMVLGGCQNRRDFGEKNGERGYTIDVPSEDFRYEKDFDDGSFEEKWDFINTDDTEIKVTTYKNSDEKTAKKRFLRENDDYVFEDLTSYPLCGTEFDGDVLWFDLHEANGNVYIVSWEYPGYADEALQKELADIAGSFRIIE